MGGHLKSLKLLILPLLLILLFSGVASASVSGYTYQDMPTVTNPTASTLTNFPAHFNINTSKLIADIKMQADCDDLIVTDTSDTLLDFEIENCNDNTKNTTVWVKIPSFPNGDTNIYVYYGNPSATSSANPSGTWSNGYWAVYHFTNKSDSLQNGAELTAITLKTSNCKYGGCYDSGEASMGIIPSAISPFGASAWIYDTSVSSRNVPFGTYTGNYKGGMGFDIGLSAGKHYWDWSGGTDARATSSDTISNSVYYFMAGIRRTATDSEVYRNGVSKGTSSTNTGSTTPSYYMCIGDASWTGTCDFNSPFAGDMDELRFHNASRTADWFTAEYSQTASLRGEEIVGIDVVINTAFETEEKTMAVDLPTAPDTITAYDLDVYYNHTLVYTQSETGISESTLSWDFPVVAPLVETNNTEIPYEVWLNYTAGSGYELNTTGTQTVDLWYFSGNYSMPWGYSVEASRALNVTLPTKPDSAPADVTYYSHSYNSSNCTKWYANGSSSIYDCTSYVTDTNITRITFSPTHFKENGLIYINHWINRSWSISFNATEESTSSKTFTGNDYNASREYFVWLVNSTNGTINGTLANANIQNIYNYTFKNELTFTQIELDGMTFEATTYFPDEESKNFSFSIADINYTTLRGYPSFYTANISTTEVFSEEDYTTRSRFTSFLSKSFSTQQNITIYMLPTTSATYGIISVTNAGAAVGGARIHILKQIVGTGTLAEIDTKITNTDGQAGAYIQHDAYYKFVVYNDEGELLYYSNDLEQFVCPSTCSITLDISTFNASDTYLSTVYIYPFVSGNYLNNDSTAKFYITSTLPEPIDLTMEVYNENSILLQNTTYEGITSMIGMYTDEGNNANVTFNFSVNGEYYRTFILKQPIASAEAIVGEVVSVFFYLLVGIVLISAIAEHYFEKGSETFFGLSLLCIPLSGFFTVTGLIGLLVLASSTLKPHQGG